MFSLLRDPSSGDILPGLMRQDIMIFTRKSIITGIERHMSLDVTQEQFERYQAGELVQNAFPHLSFDEREFIISGITPEEWADLRLW